MTPTSPAEIPFEESIWVHSLHPQMLIQDFENTVVPYRRHGGSIQANSQRSA